MNTVATAKPFSSEHLSASLFVVLSVVLEGKASGVLVKDLVENVAVKSVTKSAVRNTAEQDIIIQMAKQNKRGISMDNAKILKGWADEYGINESRIDLGHARGGPVSRSPHLHIGPVNHIPIKN